MSQIRLVLADEDSMFIEKLSTYLYKNLSHLSLELFTEPQAFANWYLAGEEADLVIISASFFFKLKKKPEQNILLLRDCAESLLPENIKCINKYIPAENLMKEMLSLCAEKIPGDSSQKKGTGKIYLVLYADGSDVLNPFAQALAYYIAARGEKTFYLNLDEFSSTDLFFKSNNDRGMNELLYYIKSKKDNLSLRFEACVSNDITSGVSFMKGHNNPDDINKITLEELMVLVDIIRSNYSSGKTVISKSFRNGNRIKALLREANKVYVTGVNHPTSIDRMSKIRNIIKGYEENENIKLNDKIMYCINPIGSNQNSENYCAQGDSTVILPYWDFEQFGLMPQPQQYFSELKDIIFEN